jgi:hypothetical protein
MAGRPAAGPEASSSVGERELASKDRHTSVTRCPPPDLAMLMTTGCHGGSTDSSTT